MNIFVADFETFYDKDFSLSGLTTEEYVRDPRFEVIGVSIKHNDGPTKWFPAPQVPTVMAALKKAPPFALLAHNTQFDGFILSHHYGIVPKFYLDTLSMARPWHMYNVGVSLAALAVEYGLGAKGTEVVQALGMRYSDFTPGALEAYGRYCCNDTELTYKLYEELANKTPKQELHIIDRTIRMFCDPRVVFDSELLHTYYEEVVSAKAQIVEQVAALCSKDDLTSNPKLALVLESLGVEPPMKLSVAKTKTAGENVMTFAFSKSDKEFTALLEHDDPLVVGVVEARLGVKSSIEETRSLRFLGMAERGPVPVQLQYYAAGPGRWGGAGKTNFQNMTRGGTLRKSIMAPPGFTIVEVDSANIELRINHTIAGQKDSIEAFRVGRDLYCEFASIIFGREITKADVAERFLGKTAHLGLGYGCGWERFQEMCRLKGVILTDADAKRIVNLWRETYYMVPKWWKTLDRALEDMAMGQFGPLDDNGLVFVGSEKLVTKPNNQILYPGLARDAKQQWFYKARNQIKHLHGPKTSENVAQHLARNIVAEQLLTIASRYFVWLTTHDSVAYLAPDSEAQQALDFGVKTMSTSPQWWPDIPLAAEGKMGKRYS